MGLKTRNFWRIKLYLLDFLNIKRFIFLLKSFLVDVFEVSFMHVVRALNPTPKWGGTANFGWDISPLKNNMERRSTPMFS